MPTIPCTICRKPLRRKPSALRKHPSPVCGPKGSECSREIGGRFSRAKTHRPLSERFWERVDIRGPDDCWEFQGYKNKGGYGTISDAGKTKKAHRVAWELAHGRKIHEGFHILHHCDNRVCCNARHLWIGTNHQNVRDMERKGRSNHPSGSMNSNSKVSEDQIREIRRRVEAGETHVSVARDFPIGRTSVSKIIARESWAHLD